MLNAKLKTSWQCPNSKDLPGLMAKEAARLGLEIEIKTRRGWLSQSGTVSVNGPSDAVISFWDVLKGEVD